MPTVRYFGYPIRSDALRATAVAAGVELTENIECYEALDLVYKAGLGGKAKLHPFSKDCVQYICIVLATSVRDPYTPRMPIGQPPPPEEYESLRKLLRTERLGRWYTFKL